MVLHLLVCLLHQCLPPILHWNLQRTETRSVCGIPNTAQSRSIIVEWMNARQSPSGPSLFRLETTCRPGIFMSISQFSELVLAFCSSTWRSQESLRTLEKQVMGPLSKVPSSEVDTVWPAKTKAWLELFHDIVAPVSWGDPPIQKTVLYVCNRPTYLSISLIKTIRTLPLSFCFQNS